MKFLFLRKVWVVKKFPVLFIFVLFFSSFPLQALDVETSIMYQPFAFNLFGGVDLKDEELHENYEYGRGQNVVYQADLKHRSGFNFGFGVGYDSGYDTNDNIVGIISDVFAQIGFKNFSVRVGQLTFPQVITLYGYNIIGERQQSFTHKRTQVDLIYRFNEPENVGYMTYYAGLTYQYITTGVNGGYTDYNFLSEKTINGYGFTLGMDTFPSAFSREDSRGFISFWGAISLMLGLTSNTEKALSTDYENKYIFFDYRGDATFGIMFGGGGKIKFAGAVGYSAEMGFYQTFHGLSLKAGIKF